METADAALDVSVIVPTLNEAGNMDALLSRLVQTWKGEGRGVEVLLADGGSTDGTQQIVRSWEAKGPVHLVDAVSGRGLTGDVLVAARQARAQVILVMDADLSHRPEQTPDLVRPVLEGRCDMAVGSRYIPGGATPDWPWVRRAVSRAAGMLAWPLTDVRDPTSGFFAVRRDRLLAVDEEAEGFKIAMEVLLQGDGTLHVMEVPITFHDRSCGQSKMNAAEAATYLRRLSALAGGQVTRATAARFALVGLSALAADLGVFSLLGRAGMDLAAAHLLSFCLAAVVLCLGGRRWVFDGGGVGVSGLLVRLMPASLMAVFLRAGILAALTERAGWPIQAALPAAAATSIAFCYVAFAFLVSRPLHRLSRSLAWRVAAVGLVGYTVLLRLLYLGLADLLPEEAYYWNYAQHPDWGYVDHPPMVAWLIGLGTRLLGDTEFGVRIGTLLCWFVTAGFSFGLARRLFDKAVALATVLLVAVLPFFFLFGFFATPDAPLTACWAGTLYFLERALLGNRRRAWWGVGLCLGLGMLSKYTIVLIIPAALTFILADRSCRRWLRRPEPWLAALVSLMLFMPVILWNLEHGWASFAFQGPRRFARPPEFGLHLQALFMMALITPVGAVAAVQAILSGRDWRLDGDPSRTHARQVRWFTVVFTVVPLSVFLAFSLRHEPKPNWTGPIWLAALPALARQMMLTPQAMRNRLERLGQQLWMPTLTATVLLFGGLLHYIAIGLPGLGIDDDMDLPVAWEEIGRDVESIEQKVEADLEQEPLVVGMDKYFIASELAFYRRDGREGVTHTASRHLLGERGLMYEWWFPPERQAGRTLLLVSFDRDDLEEGKLHRWFREVGPLQARAIRKHGHGVRYFYRIGYSYSPSPEGDACSIRVPTSAAVPRISGVSRATRL
jgi:dolichol-phosphate mannosyltransferase